MAELNIDAQLDAAKSEVTGEEHKLTFRGKTFVFPPALDILRVMDAYRQGDMGTTARLLSTLFGEEQYQELLGLDLGFNDAQLGAVLQAVVSLYGFATVGESSASPTSSNGTSGRSRQTSGASTV